MSVIESHGVAPCFHHRPHNASSSDGNEDGDHETAGRARWGAKQRVGIQSAPKKISFLFYTTDFTTEPQHATRRAMPYSSCPSNFDAARGYAPPGRCYFDTTRRGVSLLVVLLLLRYDEEGYAPPRRVVLSISTRRGGYAFPVVSSFPFQHDEEGVRPRCIVLAISTQQGGYALPVVLPFPFRHGQKGCTPSGRVIAILIHQEGYAPPCCIVFPNLMRRGGNALLVVLISTRRWRRTLRRHFHVLSMWRGG